MKSILLSLLFLFIPKLSISKLSPNDKTIYLDSLWQKTLEGNHKYYRVIKNYHSTQDLYEIKEYYKSGVIRSEGYSKSNDNLFKEGKFTLYFKNGNKQKVSQYSNNKLIDKVTEWYANGNKKSEIEYTSDEKESQNKIKIIQFWNQDNIQIIIDGNGEYVESSKEFYSAGKLKKGYKDGIWQGWQINTPKIMKKVNLFQE